MRYLLTIILIHSIANAQQAPGEVIVGQYYKCLHGYDQARKQISDHSQAITYCRGLRGLPISQPLADFPGQIYGYPFKHWIGYTDECEKHVGYARSTAAAFFAERLNCEAAL